MLKIDAIKVINCSQFTANNKTSLFLVFGIILLRVTFSFELLFTLTNITALLKYLLYKIGNILFYVSILTQ